MRFNEITLEKFLDEKQVAVKVGFYPMGNDFAVLPYLCNFTNDELCGHPITLFNNSGWADGPAGRWTGRIKYHITDELQFQTAAVDSTPLYTIRQDGFKLNSSGNTGVIAPAEFKYQLGKSPSDYGGTYISAAITTRRRGPIWPIQRPAPRGCSVSTSRQHNKLSSRGQRIPKG